MWKLKQLFDSSLNKEYYIWTIQSENRKKITTFFEKKNRVFKISKESFNLGYFSFKSYTLRIYFLITGWFKRGVMEEMLLNEWHPKNEWNCWKKHLRNQINWLKSCSGNWTENGTRSSKKTMVIILLILINAPKISRAVSTYLQFYKNYESYMFDQNLFKR